MKKWKNWNTMIQITCMITFVFVFISFSLLILIFALGDDTLYCGGARWFMFARDYTCPYEPIRVIKNVEVWNTIIQITNMITLVLVLISSILLVMMFIVDLKRKRIFKE